MWVEIQVLIAPDISTDDEFGYSISIGENWIVIGSHYDDDEGNDSESAYVFIYDGNN